MDPRAPDSSFLIRGQSICSRDTIDTFPSAHLRQVSGLHRHLVLANMRLGNHFNLSSFGPHNQYYPHNCHFPKEVYDELRGMVSYAKAGACHVNHDRVGTRKVRM